MKLLYTLFCLSITALLYTPQVRAQARVGVSAPLTGFLAEYGTSIVRGIELAKLEHSAQKNPPEFILEDNQFDSSLAISAFRSLVDVKKVRSLYTWGEPVLYATAPLIERAHLPSYSLSNDDIPARNTRSILNLQVPPEEYAQLILSTLRKQGHKTFGIIITQDLFTEAMARGFRASLKPDEKLLVDEQILPDLNDFRSIIAKLTSKKVTALGLYLQTGQVGLFARDARKAGIKSQLFGSDTFESTTEVKLSEGALHDGLFTNFKVPSEFQQKVAKSYPDESKFSFVWHSYIFATASYKVFADSKILATDEVDKNYLNAFKDLGMNEKLSAQKMRYLDMPIAVRVVTKQGGFEDL
jgi:ABC-type branched-subunit amino acid transport system substrate-binding protein